MKKLYILTFQEAINRNFGAILQSFACQELMKKHVKNVQLIDYKLKRRVSKIKKIFFYLESKSFRKFSKKYLNKSEIVFDKFQLKNIEKEGGIFIVGSDQVWRKAIVDMAGFNFYFDFVDENKKKIAYAASFGIDYWEGDEKLTEEIKPLIKRFDHISVREESGIDICKNTFGIDNVVCVLDPTLMIDKKDYQPILDDWKDKSHLKRKYIAHMLLDDTEQLKNGSKKIANYLGAEINYIKGKTLNIFGKTITLYNKVSQWLTYIKDAELVITDSFHCTVFSIIFHKKFIVVANQLRGIARLETLLKKVGLENRFFTNIDDVLESGILDKEIDYQEVDKRLDVHRKYSMDFLKKALED